MSSRKPRNRPKKSRPGNRTPRARRPAPPREPEFLETIRLARRSGNPLHLLTLASTMLALVDPRASSPFVKSDAERPSREQLFDSLLDTDVDEVSALLGALMALVDDELMAVRIRRELSRREVPIPDYATRAGRVHPTRAAALADVLGDGQNVAVEVRGADIPPFTLVTYVDHNLMYAAKDAFVAEDDLDGFLETFRQHGGGDHYIAVDELSVADACARITDAITNGARMYPPLESETWPSCRPLAEAIVAAGPSGGQGYQIKEWRPDELAAIEQAFAESEHGAAIADAPGADLVGLVLQFAANYDACDPWHFSPNSVDALLARLARKVMAPPDLLRRAPRVLRALVRFAHAEKSIPSELTLDTLAAIDECEDDYLAEIGDDAESEPFSDVQALLAAGIDPDEDPLEWFTRYMWLSLVEQTGGEAALESLRTDPLPDEPFEWDGVADDIRPAVTAVLEALDPQALAIGGSELRTVCRRLLARAATGDPAVFRRRARSQPAAAAICWIALRANGMLSSPFGTMTAKELWQRFDVSPPTGRAHSLQEAAGFDRNSEWLGDPQLLTSARRTHLAQRRDELRERLADE